MNQTIFLFTHRSSTLRPRTLLGFVLLAAAASFGIGCSSGDAEEGTLTEDAFLEAYVAETCSRASTCCTMSKVGYSPDFCRSSARAKILDHKTDLETRGLPWNFHPEHAKRCLDEMKSGPKDCSEFFGGDSCGDVYKGNAEIGDPCLQPWDCRAVDTPVEEGRTACAYYTTNGGEDKLFCQLVANVREVGEACDVSVGSPIAESVIEDCAEDGFCHRGACIALSRSGGSCPCAKGFWCGGDDNTCIPKGGIGSSCTGDDACGSNVCGDDGTCHPIGEAIRYYHCVDQKPWEG
jgi:hypothetical protein